MAKHIEYRVTEIDGHDVYHVSWRQARRLAQNPSPEIESIERVSRYGNEDNGIEREEYETLYERRSH